MSDHWNCELKRRIVRILKYSKNHFLFCEKVFHKKSKENVSNDWDFCETLNVCHKSILSLKENNERVRTSVIFPLS